VVEVDVGQQDNMWGDRSKLFLQSGRSAGGSGVDQGTSAAADSIDRADRWNSKLKRVD